jgi:hypothetical protein
MNLQVPQGYHPAFLLGELRQEDEVWKALQMAMID